MEMILKTIPNSENIIKEYKNDIKKCREAGEKELDCIKLVDLKYTRKFPEIKDMVYPWVNYDWDYTTFVDNNYNKDVTGATDSPTFGALFDNMDAMVKLNNGYIFNANPGKSSVAAISDLPTCDPKSTDYAGCKIINELRQSTNNQQPPFSDKFFNKTLTGENSSSYFIRGGSCPKPNLNKEECETKGYSWIGNSLMPGDMSGSCFKPKYAYIKNTPGIKLDLGALTNIDNGSSNNLQSSQDTINSLLSIYKGEVPSVMGDAMSLNPLALLNILNGKSTSDFSSMSCEDFIGTCYTQKRQLTKRSSWWITFLFLMILIVISFILFSFRTIKNKK